MERTDYIECREDVISNIRTLDSYLNGEKGDSCRDWAVEKLKLGINMVVEVIDGRICFGPSRFVGYINNTKEKHEQNHGNGNDTNNRISQFYTKVIDDRLVSAFQSVISKYGISSRVANYWIPKDSSVDEILSQSGAKARRYWIARLSDREYRDVAIGNNVWLMQQRYNIQKNHIVTQLLKLAKDIRVGDVLLLTFSDRIIYAYGHVVECPLQTRQVSRLSDVIRHNRYDYDNGIVRFEDAEAFYEDLRNGDEDWGQRIAIDQWHFYDPDSAVYNYGCGYACINGNPQQSIFEVNAKFALGKMKELEKQYKRKNMFISNIAELLKSKHNIILQGAPGTGKTYNTAAIALAVLGITDVNLNDHRAVMKRYDSLLGDRIFFTTFHQSLDYEDFVEGLKPHIRTDAAGNAIGVTYEPEDGIFKRACSAVSTDQSKDILECIDDYIQKIKGYENRRIIPTVSGKSSLYVWWKEGNTTISSRSTNSASQREDEYTPSPLNIEKIKLQAIGNGIENNWPAYAQAFIEAVKKEYNATANKPVVLIIDEINRGNVSKIFGELITLLEADKRSEGDHPIKVMLPYTKALFGVPSNLYIIGTMNTTDRSTGTLDYALRRRFAFVTLKSQSSVVRKYYQDTDNEALGNIAVALFEDIRRFIENPAHLCGGMDIDDLMIGHSYFLAKDEDELLDRVEYEIIPLINEYISDGIINVKDSEKKEAFDAWRSLNPVPTDEDDDNADDE